VEVVLAEAVLVAGEAAPAAVAHPVAGNSIG